MLQPPKERGSSWSWLKEAAIGRLLFPTNFHANIEQRDARGQIIPPRTKKLDARLD